MERPIEQFLDLYWQEIDKVQVAQGYDPTWGDYMRSARPSGRRDRTAT